MSVGCWKKTLKELNSLGPIIELKRTTLRKNLTKLSIWWSGWRDSKQPMVL
ncbi:hypothetical protein REPUB_Repub19eG0066600 [Reevesia pubescens]